MVARGGVGSDSSWAWGFSGWVPDTEAANCHSAVHFKVVNFRLCEFCFNRLFKKENKEHLAGSGGGVYDS